MKTLTKLKMACAGAVLVATGLTGLGATFLVATLIITLAKY